MKKFIYPLFFFLPILLFSQQSNNTLRVTYELSFQIDSLDQSSVDKEYMYLDVDDKISVFRSQTTHLKDSILSSKNPRALFGIQKSKFRFIRQNNVLYSYTYNHPSRCSSFCFFVFFFSYWSN
jgi:GLPGLI family protein